MPLVSALVPTYDRAEHVGGAIDSVLAQTHDEVEAIVVDDGSTDDTPSVLDGYDDDRVRVRRHEENRGIAAAFNTALAAADGEFVGILGDDDRWRPRKVERQLDRFAALDDRYCGVYTAGVHVRDGTVIREVRPGVEGDCFPEILLEFELLPHSSHLLRREHLRAVGGFDESFPHAVDWDASVRLAREYRFAYVPEVLVERRFHDDNVSGDAVTGDASYQVDARERLWRKYRDELRDRPDVERAFAAVAEKHRGRAAVAEDDHRRAVAHLLAATALAPTAEHAGSLAAALAGPDWYRRAHRLRQRLRGVGR